MKILRSTSLRPDLICYVCVCVCVCGCRLDTARMSQQLVIKQVLNAIKRCLN